MKKAFSLLLASFFSIGLFAQEQTQLRSFISISGGVSIPLGPFSEVSSQPSQIPGFATTGYAVSLDAIKYLSANVGFGVKGFYGSHSTNAAAITSYYSSPDGSYYASNLSSDNYSEFGFMVGPAVGFSQGKVSMDFQFLAGVMSTGYASRNYNEISNNPYLFSSANVDENAVSVTDFALGASMQLRYSLSTNLGLVFRADYINSNQVFSIERAYVITSSGNGNTKYAGPASEAAISMQMPVRFVNTCIGLAYEF